MGYSDMNIGVMEAHASSASRILKAMANERRLMILCYLNEGEHSVGELEKLLGISQSALSQHLARLRNDGLVMPRRSAQNIYYCLNGDSARTIIQSLHSLVTNGAGEAHVN